MPALWDGLTLSDSDCTCEHAKLHLNRVNNGSVSRLAWRSDIIKALLCSQNQFRRGDMQQIVFHSHLEEPMRTNFSRPDCLLKVAEWNVVCFSQTGEKWCHLPFKDFFHRLCRGFARHPYHVHKSTSLSVNEQRSVTLFQLDWLIALIRPLLFALQIFVKGHEPQRVCRIHVFYTMIQTYFAPTTVMFQDQE